MHGGHCRWARACLVLGILIIPTLLFLLWREARAKMEVDCCRANLKQVGFGLLLYAQDYDEVLPPPEVEWEKALYPFLQNEFLFQCPEDREPPSYQLHPALRGLKWKEIPNPSQTVAIFESDDGKNLAYRHIGGGNYAFMDASSSKVPTVQWYARGDEKEFIWDPRKGEGPDLR